MDKTHLWTSLRLQAVFGILDKESDAAICPICNAAMNRLARMTCLLHVQLIARGRRRAGKLSLNMDEKTGRTSRFVKVPRGQPMSKGSEDVWCLGWNNWDDFSCKKTYDFVAYDAAGVEHVLGSAKIIFMGQEPGHQPFDVPVEGLPDRGVKHRSLRLLAIQS